MDTTALISVEVWLPAMQLRWVTRKSCNMDKGIPVCDTRIRVLQQAHINQLTGRWKWVDVPVTNGVWEEEPTS